MYADVEKIVIGWLTLRFPGHRVVAELPADLTNPTIQVARFGGGRSTVPFDDANVDIDCFATSRVAAHTLAEQVSHALMYELPGHREDGALVVSAACFSAPSWLPYDNTTVRRYTAAYRIRTHNPI